MSGRRDSNPRPPAWKAGALPLSYSRFLLSSLSNPKWRGSPLKTLKWRGKDSNLRRRSAGRFTVCSLWPLGHPSDSLTLACARCSLESGKIPLPRWPQSKATTTFNKSFKAGGQSRTGDLLITNQLLYQLSYASNTKIRSSQQQTSLDFFYKKKNNSPSLGQKKTPLLYSFKLKGADV